MKLMIERPFVEALVEVWPDLSAFREQLRFGDRAEVAVAQKEVTPTVEAFQRCSIFRRMEIAAENV